MTYSWTERRTENQQGDTKMKTPRGRGGTKWNSSRAHFNEFDMEMRCRTGGRGLWQVRSYYLRKQLRKKGGCFCGCFVVVLWQLEIIHNVERKKIKFFTKIVFVIEVKDSTKAKTGFLPISVLRVHYSRNVQQICSICFTNST